MKAILMNRFVRWCVSIGIVLLFVGTNLGQGSTVQKSEKENQSRGIYTYYPIDDSYVGWPGDVNGDLPLIALRNGSWNDYWLCAGCVKFDISGIPSNASVLSATLNLYYYDYAYTNPSGHPAVLHRFLGDWDEEHISRDYMPSWDPSISDTIYLPSTAGNWLTWSVIDDVQDFVSGAKPNYGWIIKDEYFWGGANIPSPYLHSKEYGSLIPYLEIEIDDNNSSPGIPQISGPQSGIHGQTYTYAFVSSDPNSDQVYYFVDWGDGETTGWLGPYDSGSSMQLSHAWDPPGSYTIQSKARDSHGAESGWGTFVVDIINNAPEAPQISGPTSGVHGQSYDFTFVTSDPDADQVYYWVDWGDSQHTTWLGPYDSGQSMTTSHVWNAPGSYTLKAKSKDTIGDESGWAMTTITMTNNPPAVPEITGPLNGTTMTSYNFTLLSIDPDADQLYYWVDWGDGHTSGWVGPYPSNQFVVIPYAWKLPGTYIIKTKAKDVFDAQSNWTTSEITLVTNPPGAPWIVGATSGKVRQSYDFTFLSNDTDGDNVYYTIDWGDGQTTGWIGPYPSDQPVIQPHTFKKKGTYLVQAKAKDTYGAESAWGTLLVHMPLSYDDSGLWSFLERVFARFPHAFPIVRHFLGY